MKRYESEDMIKRLREQFDLVLNDTVDGRDADVLYLKNEKLYVQFIEPHEGTKWNFCIRADFPETFDRWSVCLFENDFEPEAFEDTVKDLEDFYSHKEKIIEEELSKEQL